MNENDYNEYLILDHTAQGKCIIDSQYNVRFWNKRISQFTEVTKTDIEGKKITEFFPNFNHPRYKLRIDSGFKNFAPIIFSSILHHELFSINEQKGSYFFKITITFFKDKLGENLALISLEDVTELHLRINDYNSTKQELKNTLHEQELIANELRKSQKMYSELAENVPGVIYSWYDNSDGNRGFKYISPKIKEMFGFEVEEILGNFKNLSLHPADYKGFFDSIEKAKRDFSDWSFEGRFIYQSGEIKWWYAQAKIVSYKNGNFLFNGVLYDITERKNTEISLEKSEKRFKDLAQAAGEYIWEVDLEGNYTFVTDKVENLIGYKKSELLESKPFDYIHTEDKEWVIAYFQDKVSKKAPFQKLEHRSYRKDGSVVWQRVNGVPIFDNGYLVGFRGTASDITEEKEITNKLKINEERLSLSLISAGQGLWDWDLITNEAYFNEEWSRLMGYGKKEIKEDISFWFSTIHPEDLKKLKEKIYDQLFIGSEQFLDFNYRAFNNNEEWIWINVRGKIVSWDKSGNPERVIGIIQNITERKLAEEVLQRREQEFKALADNAPDIITRLDRNLRYIYINPAFEKEFNIKINAALGKTPNETLNFINDSENWADKILDVFNEKTRIELNSSVIIKNEINYFDTQIVPEFNDKGEVHTLLTISRNITEIKKAEEEILKINEYNEILNDISTTLVNASISNIDNYLHYAIKLIGQKSNSNHLSIYQFSANRELLINNYEWSKSGNIKMQDNFQGLLVEDLPWMLKILSERENFSYDINDEIPDYAEQEKAIINKSAFKSILAVPMIVSEQLYGFILLGSNNERNYDNGNLISFLKMANEILTGNLARKDFDNELLQAKNEAEAASKAKSVFLANISHEIRTPMNAVIGFADILKDRLHEPKHLEYLNGILSSGKSLLNLINDILDLSKIESGKMEIQLQPNNIKKIVEDIYLMFSLKAKQKGLDFYLNIDEKLNGSYLIDELRIKQVLINLLGNAVKFTHHGFVSLNVTFDYVSNGIIDLIFSIKDSGIGIPESDQKKIFEPFRQQDEQDTRLYGGTGLGLTITERLVDMMNGQMQLQSNVGVGSEFIITIPDVEFVEAPPEEMNEINFKNVILEHKNVLIADNDEMNIRILTEYLNDYLFNIKSVRNGKELLEAVDKFKLDIIIFNIQLPIINGFDVAKSIRSEKDNDSILLIAVTSYTDKNKIEEIKKYADTVMIKPLNKKDLLDNLINFLPHKLIYDDENASENNKNNSINYEKQFSQEIYEILENDILKKWESVKANHIISEIGEFAKLIHKIGEEYQEQELIKYGNTLYNYVDSFNIEKMIDLLEKFIFFILAKAIDNNYK